MTAPRDPLLSVVVATRNDDHGGDPLKRLQAFVNTFAGQCARSRLDAEIIVVEWNPPSDRPRVRDLLHVPPDATCVVRFVEVPHDLHTGLRFGDVLPLFQMIAKNVGIRRARGRFILATNIDIIFANELVDWLASHRLESQRIYRVDRHDIEPEFPVNAALDEQMAYCTTHQLRVHTRAGTHAVDSEGRERLLDPDIAGSTGITLGDGWHMREGDAASGFFRWATREVRFGLDRTASPHARPAALDIDLESNPYQPGSWVDLEILDGPRRLVRRRLSGRIRLRLELDDAASQHEIVMRALDSSGGRDRLPLFQNREQLWYRVHGLHIRTVPADVYDPALWRRSSWTPRLLVQRGGSGVEVVSDRRYPYGAQYGPFESPSDGRYEFLLEYERSEGCFTILVRDDQRASLLPASVAGIERGDTRLLRLEADLKGGVKFSLVLASEQPDGCTSRCVIRRLVGSVPLSTLRRTDLPARFGSVGRLLDTGAEVLSMPLRLLKNAVRAAVMRRDGLRQTIVEQSAQVRDLESRLAALAQLADLAGVARLLQEHRPPELHQNACGDFQLMAREHWFALRGYPEFEMFSMSIDGLMESLACAAGLREEILRPPLCIYHLEHEKGSGWTPEGEALLRKRIAESGITWLDSHTVDIWTAYMLWLKRPMIFNGADWGLGDAALAETTLQCVADRA